jgi:hypothetical protein
MKILIVGFGRSGTTLTYRIYGRHPQVKKALLEACTLAFYKNKKQLLRKKPFFKGTCCEKVIYGSDKLRKSAFGTIDMSIVDYCERWLDWFGNEARIIHLVRHPLDTLFSLMAKKARRMKLTTGFEIEKLPDDIRERLIEGYLNVVPKYPNLIYQLPQTLTVKYEDIIMDRNTIKRMYEFCNLYPYNFSERLRTRRVFGYQKSGFNIDQSVKHIVRSFNKMCEGVKYK